MGASHPFMFVSGQPSLAYIFGYLPLALLLPRTLDACISLLLAFLFVDACISLLLGFLLVCK
jgi:hypothetical protein